MEQLKQHYEKAILGLAMLALVYVAYGVLTDNSEEAIAEQVQARERPDDKDKKPMPQMVTTDYHATLGSKSVGEGKSVDLGGRRTSKKNNNEESNDRCRHGGTMSASV